MLPTSKPVPVNLRWAVSVPASCFHTAAALLEGRPLADPRLADSLASPLEAWQAMTREDPVPVGLFFAHLIPLVCGSDSLRDAVEVALVKTIGRKNAVPRVEQYLGLLIGLKNAFAGAIPALAETLAIRLEFLHRGWALHGPGLLTAIVNVTEPGLLVEEATVVLLHCALGGAGSAYLAYNLAAIEAPAEDDASEADELLRLGWLISQLNLDLPRFSENIPPSRLSAAAGLAMVPVVLAAGEACQLAACDEAALARAVPAWLGPAWDGMRWAGPLLEWWQTYRSMRPRWTTALAAMDRLLAEEGPPSGAGAPGS